MSRHAMVSGLCACFTSVFSKLSFGSFLMDQYGLVYSSELVMLLRVVSFALFVLSNLVMWNQFAKALAYSPTTVHAVILNSTVNFISTGICGRLLFGERYGLSWWVGVSLILCGAALVQRSGGGGRANQSKDN